MSTAVVTGASRGIGLAICRKFLSEGWKVYGLYSGRSSSPSDFESLTTFGDSFHMIRCDVSSEKDVITAFDSIYAATGTIDALVNNAGISFIGLLQDMTAQEWDRVISINLRSVFLCSRAVIRPMVRVHKGTIVNISSMWGEKGASMEVAYSASKGGMNTFTKALSQELSPSGIRVNAISCGAIDTSMNHFLSEEERKELESSIGLGRFGRPDEVAELAYFLASDASSYITGQIIGLDGGF